MGRDGVGKAKLPPQNDNATPSITGGDGIGVHWSIIRQIKAFEPP
jgi:hypothetical protein